MMNLLKKSYTVSKTISALRNIVGGGRLSKRKNRPGASLWLDGFTLIELLIVIAIIGILTALITTNLQAARERARDSRRKTDLQSINQSLRLYYSDYQTFPTGSAGVIRGCGATGTTACPWGGAFGTGTTTYMGYLPLDPASSSTNSITYYYQPTASGNNFILVAKLENPSDDDMAMSQTRCGSIYSSASGFTKEANKDYVVCAE